MYTPLLSLSRALSLSLTLLCALSPPLASAEPAQEAVTEQLNEAAELQQRAVEAVKRGAFDEALEHLARVKQLSPEPLTLFLIAKVQTRAERCAEAEQAWADFERSCHSCDLLTEGRALLGQLRARCVGTLKVEGTPMGAEVKASGAALGAAPLDLKTPAGDYLVSVSAPGYSTHSERVTLAPKGAAVVRYALTPVALVEGARPLAVLAAPPAPAAPSWGLAPRLLLIGGGVVALGGGVMAVYASSSLSATRDEALATRSLARFSDLSAEHERLRGLQAASLVTLGVGGALALGGLAWGLAAAPASDAPLAARPALLPLPGGALVGLSGSLGGR